MAHESKPALITCGASAYSQIIDFERMGKIARDVVLICLSTWRTLPDWWRAACTRTRAFADFVTSTTHKSLRGPRGGVILCKEEFAKKSMPRYSPASRVAR